MAPHKSIIARIALVVLSASLLACLTPRRSAAATQEAISASLNYCGYPASLGDGFNSSSLNPSRWSTQYGSGGGGEKQYYGPNAFKISNSILSITAAKTPANGYPYTSGIIHTKGKFAQEYGRFEILAKLPKGKGFWPAFWLLPAKPDFPVEIDVFENLGKDTHTIYMSNHYKGTNGSNQHITIPYTSPVDLSAGFHTYTLDWTATRLTWYLDGKQLYTTTQHVPHEPMFMIANLAVGGTWGGYPDASTAWPGIMQIQWVRAFKQVCP